MNTVELLQKEASEVDVMGFLLDGRIQHFEGDSEQIVIDRFKVSEIKRVSNLAMKKKVTDAKRKCAKIKDKKERTKCIFKHMKEYK